MSADRGIPGPVLEEAAEWYWALREPDAGVEEIAAWQAWIGASEVNRQAFREIERTLECVDRCGTPPWPGEVELVCDTYDGSEPVSDWRKLAPQPASPGSRDARQRGPAPARFLLAASAAVLVVGGALHLMGWSPLVTAPLATEPDFAVYETRAGEHRDIRLPDGSMVTLGGRSSISMAFTPERRAIVLEHGAAYLDVQKDPQRPFVVRAVGREIAAIGTAFNVKRHSDRVVVTVTEGAVMVTPETGANSTAGSEYSSGESRAAGVARVEAGQQIAYNEAEVTALATVNAEDAIAWRDGRLKYLGEPLRYVVDDVNRYRQQPIRLADDRVAEMLFTGTVFEERIDSWLSGLEQAFPIEVDKGPAHVTLSYRPQ